MKKVLLFLLAVFAASISWSQRSILDSSMTFSKLKMGYTYQIPGGDLKDRFGNNSSIGGDFGVKFKSSLYVGVKGSFIFGNNVKEKGILDGIKTSNGNVIDNGGELGSVFMDERGFSFFLTVGKLFPFLSPNPNSGFFVTMGGGILQHKIRFEFRDSNIPPLKESYRKGYDRLSNGFALNEFIGYMFLSNNKLINFYCGFDFTQGWTQNRRGFNFDTGLRDTKKRSDYLYGFQVGWILPLYKRVPDEFYYY